MPVQSPRWTHLNSYPLLSCRGCAGGSKAEQHLGLKLGGSVSCVLKTCGAQHLGTRAGIQTMFGCSSLQDLCRVVGSRAGVNIRGMQAAT